MHSAPAVSYPVGRSRFQGWLVGVTGLTGMLAGLLWQLQAHLDGWRQGLFVLSLLGACSLAIAAWRRTPVGTLRWDGQAWHWSSGDTSAGCIVSVQLDLQSCLLLSMRSEAGARLWLWPERRADVIHWDDLRRALFSRGGVAHAPAAVAEAALAQMKS
jgi:hypothetical protein